MAIKIIQAVGYIAAVILPLFNIPLMMRIVKRRSSADLSLTWVLGTFACLVAIEPPALLSPDPMFKFLATVNVIVFSGVVFLVLKYHPRNR